MIAAGAKVEQHARGFAGIVRPDHAGGHLAAEIGGAPAFATGAKGRGRLPFVLAVEVLVFPCRTEVLPAAIGPGGIADPDLASAVHRHATKIIKSAKPDGSPGQ